MLSANLSGYPARPKLEAIREYIRTGGENPFTLAVKTAVQEQVSAKVDIITDGQVRDIVSLIAVAVPGITTSNSDIEVENRLGLPRAPVALDDFLVAVKECGDRAQVKASLPGPMSFASKCQIDPKSSYRSTTDINLLFDIASVLEYEVNALRQTHARIIQIVENADDIHDWEVFLELLSTVFKKVPTPICHIVGDVSPVFTRLLESAATTISFDVVAFPQNCSVAGYKEELLVHEKLVSLGCVDASTPRNESINVIERRVGPFVASFGYESVSISPSETLARLSPPSALSKLQQLEVVKRRYASRSR